MEGPVFSEGPEQDHLPMASEGISDENIKKPRVMRNLRIPIQAERDEHNASHMPTRQWCPVRVRGKDIRDHYENHKHHTKDTAVPGETTIPTVSTDYAFVGTRMIKANKYVQLAVYDNKI